MESFINSDLGGWIVGLALVFVGPFILKVLWYLLVFIAYYTLMPIYRFIKRIFFKIKLCTEVVRIIFKTLPAYPKTIVLEVVRFLSSSPIYKCISVENFPKSVLNNFDYITEYLTRYPNEFTELPFSYRANKKLVLKSNIINPNALMTNISSLPFELKSDKEIAHLIIGLCPLSYIYLCNDFLKDKELCFKVLKRETLVYGFLSEEILDDYELTKIAILGDPGNYMSASERLKEEPELISLALSNSSHKDIKKILASLPSKFSEYVNASDPKSSCEAIILSMSLKNNQSAPTQKKKVNKI